MPLQKDAYIIVMEPDAVALLECVDLAIETAIAGGFIEMAEELGGLYSRFWHACRPFFVNSGHEKGKEQHGN